MVEEDPSPETGGGFWGDEGVAQPEPDVSAEEQAFTLPPVSGLVRRFTAFAIDGLLLGLVFTIVGLSLSSFWFQAGPYGRFLGLAVGLAYFGVMDSRLGKGQTLGKRLLKVAVTDADGQSVGVGLSLLRTLIWFVPFILNGWALPLFADPIVSAIVSFIVLGLGGAVVLTVVFNRRTGQGLHDLLTHTYVVHRGGRPVEAMPSTRSLPWVLSGAALLVALVFTAFSGVLISGLGVPIQDFATVQKSLMASGKFFTARVGQLTTTGSEGTSRILQVDVWYKGLPTESERSGLITEVARQALALNGVNGYDGISVTVQSAYDLGFATGHLRFGDAQTVSSWRTRVGG
jgi:uncharacterized RDD family membrane protein YckC